MTIKYKHHNDYTKPKVLDVRGNYVTNKKINHQSKVVH